MPLAIIALGSNLGDCRLLIRSAMDRLEHCSTAPLLRSSLWRSAPVDCPPGSSGFINAVVGARTRPRETPETLLGELQTVEGDFGRQRTGTHNESRPLDLDLIAFGDEIRATSQLILPHPRAHLRRFVLEPLAEILPDLKLPGQQATVRTLLVALGTEQDVVRLA